MRKGLLSPRFTNTTWLCIYLNLSFGHKLIVGHLHVFVFVCVCSSFPTKTWVSWLSVVTMACYHSHCIHFKLFVVLSHVVNFFVLSYVVNSNMTNMWCMCQLIFNIVWHMSLNRPNMHAMPACLAWVIYYLWADFFVVVVYINNITCSSFLVFWIFWTRKKYWIELNLVTQSIYGRISAKSNLGNG